MAANIKEIKSRIKGVQSTHKITKAMEVVSSTKFKRYSKLVGESRPYSEAIDGILSNIATGIKNEKNPFGVLSDTGKTWERQSRYDNIFHPFYVYELFDIDIGMTPENVKTYLDSASPYVNMTSFDVTKLSNTIGNLKF